MLELLLGPADAVTPHVALAITLGGMFLLAVADVWREEVEDWATAALLALVVGALLFSQITAGQWVNGALSAAAAFTIYLWLGTKGVMGGGDVKLSIVPALALGATNPFLVIWWVAAAIATHQVMAYATTWTARDPGRGPALAVALPHVPAMAIAAALATVVFPV